MNTMKKISAVWKRVLCIFMAAAFILSILPEIPASAAEADSENTYTYGVMKEDSRGYQVDGKTYHLYKGAFRYAGYDPGKDSEALFYFSPGFFANDPLVYKPELATASAAMAIAGFYSNEGEVSTKRSNIVQFMQDIGCDPKDVYSNIYNTIEPQTDSIGVTMGSMKLDAVEEGRVLIPIAIRGGNYEKEWASNVTLGTQDAVADGEAKGFSTAATIVFSEVQNYIKTHGLEDKAKQGKITFWIAGYSRAGATANLTAKRLIDEYLYNYKTTENKFFAYCIEAPQGGTAAGKGTSRQYGYIHNVIDKGDVVPLAAPSGMGFIRYGIDHYIPGSSASATPSGPVDKNEYDNHAYEVGTPEYNTKHGHMIGQLKAVEPRRVFSDFFEVRGLDTRELKGTMALVGISLLNPVHLIGTIVQVAIRAITAKKEDILRTGEKMRMDDFLVEFMKNLQDWTGLSRDSYAGKKEEKKAYYGNIETVLRDYMTITRDSTGAQMAEFRKRVKGLWDNGTIGILKAISLFYGAFDKWDDPKFTEKEKYKAMFVDWLDKSKCFDALELTSAEKERVLKTDVPALLDFALTYAARDYHHDLHKTNGSTQILTMLRNIENIMLNHMPDVILAWLRADDPLYKNDIKPITVVYNEPSTPVLTYGGKEIADAETLTINPKKFGVRENKMDLTIPGTQLFGTKLGYEFKKGEERIGTLTLSDSWPIEISRLPELNQGTEYELVYWSENVARKTADAVDTKSVILKIDYSPVEVVVYSYDSEGNEKRDVKSVIPGERVPLNTNNDRDGKYFVYWNVVSELNNNSKTAERLEDQETSFVVGSDVRSIMATPVYLDLPGGEELEMDLPYPADWETIEKDDSAKVKIVEDPTLPPTTEYIMSPVDKKMSDDRKTLTITIPKKVKTWDNKEKTIKQKEVKLQPTETPKPIPSGNPDIALEQRRIEEKTTEAGTVYEVEIAITNKETPKPQDRDITITCVNLVTGQTQEVVQKTYKDGDITRVEAPVLNNLLFYRWADLTDGTQYEPERTAPSEGNLTVEYLPVVEKMDFNVVLPEEEVQTRSRAASAASLTSGVLTMAGGETYELTAEQLQAFMVNPGERENSDVDGMQNVPVMIIPNADSILSVFPIDPDVSVTVNGAEASFGSFINDAGEEEGFYIMADILVPAPAPEPEPEKSTEISIVVDPDDITADHGSELSALLPATVPVQYTDGRIESLPVTWNTADAIWYLFKENEDGGSDWEQLPDVPVANIADQVYCALTGDVQEPAGTTFVEETAGNGMVTLGVYIAGLPDAAMPWPTLFEGEYDAPLEFGLFSVDQDENLTGERVFYTLDGSNPKTSPTSMLYTGPITLGKGITETTEYTIFAYAAGDYVNTDDSDIMCVTYTVHPEKEKKDVAPASNKVDTGDPNHMTYWIIGMAAAIVLIAAAVILFSVRRRNRK